MSFRGRQVLNTHFPPFPSPAFDRLVEQFGAVGEAGPRRRLFSVTWAVTNRCHYRCWHCYNAGRRQEDVPLDAASRLAGQLQELGAVKVNLTGGEPLLRDDLEDIARCFDERSALVVGSTGDGLTPERAEALVRAGVFAIGISLDSTDEAEHDRLRGRPGAFRTALQALSTAGKAGLYPYVVAVAVREFLQHDRFMDFMRFAGDAGALEVHLLEPTASGRLTGRTDVLLGEEDRRRIVDYQREVAAREDLPVLSSFIYLESADAFGCGAGLTHLYIDGSGEVCPCNLVALSFGNFLREPLTDILDRMGEHFRRPRCECVGRTVAGHIPPGRVPAGPHVSAAVCRECLPAEHDAPRFFKLRKQATSAVGATELRDAYDRVHDEYDEFWVAQAGAPVDDLIARLHLSGGERVFEAGCGTGYATRRLADLVGPDGSVLAADISEGMLAGARRRLGEAPGVQFVAADALEILRAERDLDLIFSSWVLGYIPFEPFLAAAAGALAAGGRLAFVVHKKDSPLRETQLFAEIAFEHSGALLKRVDFGFPRDIAHVLSAAGQTGLDCRQVYEGSVTFEYANARGALEHLLKSGAGTAFYDAVDPAVRPQLEQTFLERLAELNGPGPCRVVHDYVACIAVPSGR